MPRKRYSIIANNIEYEIYKKKLQKEEEKRKNANTDTNNREKVKNKIKEYMNRGMSQEDAVDYLMLKDKELVKQFDYLEINGLDIRMCFVNWTKNLLEDIDQNKEEER